MPSKDQHRSLQTFGPKLFWQFVFKPTRHHEAGDFLTWMHKRLRAGEHWVGLLEPWSCRGFVVLGEGSVARSSLPTGSRLCGPWMSTQTSRLEGPGRTPILTHPRQDPHPPPQLCLGPEDYEQFILLVILIEY